MSNHGSYINYFNFDSLVVGGTLDHRVDLLSENHYPKKTYQGYRDK